MKSFFNSKLARTVLCLTLALSMMLSLGLTANAQISGAETWYGPSDQSAWFTVTNNNLTQRKTMGFSGPLWIWFDFNQADSASYPPIYLTVEIRNLTKGTVDAIDLAMTPDIKHLPTYKNVEKGDVLQFFFDVKTDHGYTPPGPYRKANIQYGYSQEYGTWF